MVVSGGQLWLVVGRVCQWWPMTASGGYYLFQFHALIPFKRIVNGGQWRPIMASGGQW